MNEPHQAAISPVRFEDGKPQLLVGLNERCTSNASIPAQCQRFVPHLGHIPGQMEFTAYGVVHNGDGDNARDYMCAVEFSDMSQVPAGLSLLRLPQQRYAAFVHADHVSTIHQTWMAIFKKWLPESGYNASGRPAFEVYTETFNPATGNGGLEIWVPIVS